MDRFHPERATRLNSTQRKYYEIFGGDILKARDSFELRDALICLTEDIGFKEECEMCRSDGNLHIVDDVLVGVRHAVRESLAGIGIDDLSFSAVKKAGLGIAFAPLRLLLSAVTPENDNLTKDPRGGPYEGFVEHATHAWDRAGRKIYSVSPGLRWRLENTELRGVRSCDFRLPYRCIYIDLAARHRVAPSYHIDPDSGLDIPGGAPAEGVYVVEDHVNDLRVVHLVVISAGGTGGAIASGSLRDGSEMSGLPWTLTLKFPEGSMVKDSVGELVFMVGEEARGMLSPERSEQATRDALSIFSYILNVVMYTTTPDLDACVVPCDPEYRALFDRAMKAKKGSKKRKALLDRAKGSSDQRMTILGGNIYVDKGRESGGTGNGMGSKATVRTLAAGHWKRVVHGVGRKERRMSWIEPYWRGPELGPVSQKKHVLTDRSSRGQA